METPIFTYSDVKDILSGALHFAILDQWTFDKLMNRLEHDKNKKEFEALQQKRKDDLNNISG